MARRSVFVLAALLLTVSCSGEQKGATPPPPASAPTASPTATPTPSATPFVSSADEAGAFAFARNYFSQLNRAVTSGNVASLQPLRRATCSCVKLEKDIDSVYSRGGRVVGAQLRVEELLLGESGPAFAKVTAKFRTSAGSTLAGDGTRSPLPVVRGYQYLSLVRDGDHWIIDDLQTQQVPG